MDSPSCESRCRPVDVEAPVLLPRLRLALAASAGAIAVVALVGTFLGLPQLAAMGRGLVPIAPFGAGLLLLLVGAGLGVECRPDSPAWRRTAFAAALIVGLAGLARVGAHLAGSAAPLEAWWVARGRDAQLTSPLTALGLLGAAASAGLLWWPGPTGQRRRQAAAAAALVPLIIGPVVLISYLAGAPLLYGSGQIPMSLPSALCLVCYGLFLMLSAGWDTWPLAAFGLHFRLGRHTSDRRPYRRNILVFLLLGTGVLTIGSFYLRSQLRVTRAQVQSELAAIGGLKAQQISAWYGERLSQAQGVLRGRLIQAQFARFLAGPGEDGLRADLQGWMDEIQKGAYRQVILYDRTGRARMISPVTDSAALAGVDGGDIRKALEARDVLVEDLHTHSDQRTVLLNLWVPVGTGSGGAAQGAILFLVDPRQFLYPLVRSWPTDSPSAETLLVRRAGEDVLYLNDVRHQEGSALNLRLPLVADPGMPSVRAALGQEGLVEGHDYRGARVLAVLQRVPGTDWRMVAKVDEAEVYGPLRRRVWFGGTLLVGVVALMATALALRLRHHDTELIRTQLGLTQRFEWLMREANDIILVMDREGRILEANARAEEHYGYPLSELLGRSVMDLCDPQVRAGARQRYAHTLSEGSTRFESVHLRKDGSPIPVEVSARAVPLDGDLRVISFTRDISERRAQEREIQRMTQLYSALSQVNQAIVWSRNREALFARICEVMVQYGKFSMAWIGWDDPITHRVEVAARHGDSRGMLDRVVVRSDNSPEGLGALGTAIRLGCPSVINDFLGALESYPWRQELQDSGFLSIAAFPIREGGLVRGALAVYASEVDFFGTHESALLEEAARDISFALDQLANETRRQEAEAALQESERFLMEAQEAGGIGTYTWHIQEDSWKSSPYLDHIFGIDQSYRRDLKGWVGIIAPEFRADMQAYVEGIIDRRERFDLDYPIDRVSDGARRWVHGQGDIRWDPAGRPLALVGIIQDITDRKLAERALQKVTVAVEQSPLSIVITDPRGVIEYVNPAFTTATGYSRAEAIGQNPRILRSPGTPPDHYQKMWETLARGEVWVGEFENLRKNRERFFEWATIAPVCDEDGQLTSYIAIKEDITDQKRSQEERRQLEAHLQQSQKLESLGSLAGGVAHDMNNVLGAILGLASTLKEASDPGTTTAKGLETIVNACLRGRGVVKSLLYFAHKGLQEEQPTDLNGLVREMQQLLSHTVPKQVELKVELREGLRPVRGDAGALSHALMNLCVNALDAMPGGGTLSLRTAQSPDGSLSLLVRDTGEGMGADTLAKAVEPFFTTKPQGRGTGLGLAMVYGTMKAHDGDLILRSRPGEGTEAELRFPPSRAEAPRQEAPASAHAAVPDGGKPLQILLVDDDELIRDSVMPMLEMLGHGVSAVPGGPEAIRHLEAGAQVDLVILDMNMPGMSGAEALPLILNLRPGVPVIVSTGYSDQEVAPLLAGRPLVSSIRKPFSLKELQSKLAGTRRFQEA